MIHWTDIEKSKEGILQILEVIRNYDKDGEVRFIAGIQGRHFSEYKIQQLICIVRERLNMTRRELLRLSEIALTYNKLWATDDNNCFRDADKLFRKMRSTLKGTKIIYKRFTPIMTRFDTYADKGRGKMMDTTAIAEFVCWTGLGIAKGYSYFASTYKGIYDLPQKKSVWARFNSFKKADPEASKDGGMEMNFAADFEKRMNSRI